MKSTSKEQQLDYRTKAKYARKAHVIRDLASGDIVFSGKDSKGKSSINAAKKHSRTLPKGSLYSEKEV